MNIVEKPLLTESSKQEIQSVIDKYFEMKKDKMKMKKYYNLKKTVLSQVYSVIDV